MDLVGLPCRPAATTFSQRIRELKTVLESLEQLHDSEVLRMTCKIAELKTAAVKNTIHGGTHVSYKTPSHESLPQCDSPNAPIDATNATVVERDFSARSSVPSAAAVDVTQETAQKMVPSDIVESPSRKMVPSDIVAQKMVPEDGAEQGIAGSAVDEKGPCMEESPKAPATGMSSPEASARTAARMTRALSELQLSPTEASSPVIYRVLGRSSKPGSEADAPLLRLMTSPLMDITIAMVISANCIIMGIEVEERSVQPVTHSTYDSLDVFFNIFFLCELILRLAALGCGSFFCGENGSWNIFDFLLVGFGWLTIISNIVSVAPSQMAYAKAFKVLRVLRIFRVFRFFRQLATLTMLVLSSLYQLFWALVLFALIIFIAALALSGGAVEWLQAETQDFTLSFTANTQIEAVHRRFGGVGRCSNTLFQVALGGTDWGSLTDLAFELGWVYVVVLRAYITFVCIAVLNVFTGVFVEEALQRRHSQADIMIEDSLARKKRFITQIRDFFAVIDDDHSGTLSLAEIRQMMNTESLSAFFDHLGLKTQDAEQMFKLLDVDGSGSIGLDEFLEGCENMTGSARGIDLHVALMKLSRLNALGRETLAAVSDKPICRRQGSASHSASRLSLDSGI